MARIIIPFYRRFGAWAFSLGILCVYTSTYFIDSILGLVVLVISAIVTLADPVIHIFLVKEEDYPKKPAIVAWAVGAIAFALFLLRRWLDVPLETALPSDENIVFRIRRLLLGVFLIGTAFSVVYRLFLQLGTTSLAYRKMRVQGLGNAAISITAALGLIILANYMTSIRNPLLDLTPGYFSFSAGSSTILKSISGPIEVTAFLPDSQAFRSQRKATVPELYRISEDIRAMLEQLPLINGNIKVKFMNADLQLPEQSDFGTVTNGTIVLRSPREVSGFDPKQKPYTERKVYVYSESEMDRMEKELVRSALQCASPQKTAYFTSSNGERYNFLQKTRNSGAIDTFQEQLRFYNFNVKALNEDNAWPGEIPKDADLVLLVGPTTAYGTEARKAILDYLGKGGRLFVTIEKNGTEDFQWLIDAMSDKKYVYTRASLTNVKSLPGVLLTDGSDTHRITENLNIAGSSALVFPQTGYFDDKGANTDSTIKGLKSTAFVYSPFVSFDDLNRNGIKDASEKTGRFPIAFAFENESNQDAARIALFASTDWLTEMGLRFPVDQRNIILAADSVFWLTESKISASLIPEKRETRAVQVTDELKTKNILLGVVIFPVGSIVLTALMIFVYRKRRQFLGTDNT